LLAETGEYYRRGDSVTKLVRGDDGEPILRAVKTSALPGAFESVATLWKWKMTKEGLCEERAICGKQAAELVAAADAFLHELPPIKLLTRTPILAERDGNLAEIVGYDRTAAVYAGGQPADDVPLAEAVGLLVDLLADFRFATLADKSRAMAAILTPALLHGGLLGGRAPADLGESDKSQTGKGFRNKLTGAIYRTEVRSVTQRSGGVGGLEETFNSFLIAGASLLAFDNVRGKINSPAIESFLTEDRYAAREPYSGNVEIDPRRIIVMMTSNRAEFTRDFANRSSCVRLLKQPDGYQFRRWPGGNLLDHVRENQPRYLGAVFAVVREWHRQGKPRTEETRHDFREWAQILDWIVQNVFRLPPLMDGHRETLERTTNPTLNWLRDVTLAVADAEQFDRWLRTHDLLDILTSAGLEVPGLPDGADPEDDATRDKALRAIGRKLGLCFRSDRLELDGITCERSETVDTYSRPKRKYRFSRPEPPVSRSQSRSPEDNGSEKPLVSRSSRSPESLSNISTHGASESKSTSYENVPEPCGTSGVQRLTSGATSGDFGRLREPQSPEVPNRSGTFSTAPDQSGEWGEL